MTPSVGRIVHVYGLSPFPSDPVAAMIVRVQAKPGLHPQQANDEQAHDVWLVAFPPKVADAPSSVAAAVAAAAGAPMPEAFHSRSPVPFSAEPKAHHWTWPPRV